MQSEEFSPAWSKKHGFTGISMSSQELMKAAGHARMQKVQKVCHLKCMVFSVSVLSHTSATLNFK